jgi:hypothetical protein
LGGDDEAEDEALRWLNEQAAVYDTRIKKLVPSLQKCVEKHGDCVET